MQSQLSLQHVNLPTCQDIRCSLLSDEWRVLLGFHPSLRPSWLRITQDMFDIVAEWKYSDRVTPERQEALADPGSYEELIRRVITDVQGINAYSLPGSDHGLTDCIQPIFTFELPNVGDALFNGPWGYRAQYWLSASRGIGANRALISALTPKLLSAVDINKAPNLAKIDICASLAAVSAKLWIRESSNIMDALPDLAVQRWVNEALAGVELARLGLQASSSHQVRGQRCAT